MRVLFPVQQLSSSSSLFIIFSVFSQLKINAANSNNNNNNNNSSSNNAINSRNRPFLDVYLRVEPVDDFCGALRCNISYAILLTNMQNKFDLHSLMLQDGHMPRRSNENGQQSPPAIGGGGFFFEDNTVVRLSDELRNKRDSKIYLGLMLFDLPDDIQDYLVVEVTNVIRTGRRVKTEFSSDTVRIGVQVYRRNEAASSVADHSAPISDQQQKQRHFAVQMPSLSRTITTAQQSHNEQQRQQRPIEQGFGQKGGSIAVADAVDGLTEVIISTAADDGKPLAANREKCATNVTERSWTCCKHVTVRKIRLDDEVCVNVTYLPTKIGVNLAVSVNGHVYYSKDLAVLNPESACFEVPELREYASICINLYNMELKQDRLSGCAKLEAILLHLRVAQHKIGCFSIPV